MHSTTLKESGTAPLKVVAVIAAVAVVSLLVLYLGEKHESEQRAADLQQAAAELSQTIAGQESELKRLRNQVGEMERMRRENKEIHELRAASGELNKLRPENQKLRAEIGLLRARVAKSEAAAADLRRLQQESAANQRKAIVAQTGAAMSDLAAKNACIANLRQLDGAKQQWAIDNKRNASDIPGPADLFGSRLYLKIEPTCPLGDGRYTLHSVGQNPTCSHPEHRL